MRLIAREYERLFDEVLKSKFLTIDAMDCGKSVTLRKILATHQGHGYCPLFLPMELVCTPCTKSNQLFIIWSAYE